MLPDLLRQDLDLLICGTAASTRSAELKQYYAGPGNKFWSTLSSVGLTPTRLEPRDYLELLNLNIGLSDVVKHQSGMDHQINFNEHNNADLSNAIQIYQPKIVCFNGKKAAKVFYGKSKVEFGVQEQKLGNSLMFIAPSTSGAANASWDIRIWHQLADLRRQLVARET